MSDILHFASRSLGAPMLFSALPADVQEGLRKGTQLRRYSAGQIIQQRGDQPDGFWLIEEGSVSVGQFLRDGEFRAVALLGPGDSWGELAMFTGSPRVVDSLARSECSVRHILTAQFEAILRENPLAMRPLMGALSRQLQEMLDVVAAIRRGSASARVAGLLATLSSDAQLPAKVGVSQQELAELLGLTRATVSTSLKQVEQRGLIRRGYGHIEVMDRDGLNQFAME